MPRSVFSADSHVVEPPDAYCLLEMEQGQPPFLQPDGSGGEWYVIPGMAHRVGLGFAAPVSGRSAPPTDVGTAFADLDPSAFVPGARLMAQERQGIAAEVLYPTVGLFLLDHVNRSYSRQCFRSYNRWLASFVSLDSTRLIGVGVCVPDGLDRALADVEEIANLGLAGVLLPADLGRLREDEIEDLLRAIASTGLPLSFHRAPSARYFRWSPRIMPTLSSTWDLQELLVLFLERRLFERVQDLAVVIAEFGWRWLAPFLSEAAWALASDESESGHSRSVRPTAIDHSLFVATSDPQVVSDADFPAVALWASDFPHASWCSPVEPLQECEGANRDLVNGFMATKTRSLYLS